MCANGLVEIESLTDYNKSKSYLVYKEAGRQSVSKNI